MVNESMWDHANLFFFLFLSHRRSDVPGAGITIVGDAVAGQTGGANAGCQADRIGSNNVGSAAAAGGSQEEW